MQKIQIREEDFDRLMEMLSSIKMEDDDYIPSEEDIFDYIERFPERYYLYLLWYSEHRPKPKNEEERKNLKKIIKIINNTIEIV